jgi:hypothetical protein
MGSFNNPTNEDELLLSRVYNDLDDYTVDDFDLFIQELCVLILKLYVNHCKSTLKNVFTVIRFMSGLRQILQ